MRSHFSIWKYFVVFCICISFSDTKRAIFQIHFAFVVSYVDNLDPQDEGQRIKPTDKENDRSLPHRGEGEKNEGKMRLSLLNCQLGLFILSYILYIHKGYLWAFAGERQNQHPSISWWLVVTVMLMVDREFRREARSTEFQ